MLAKSDSERIQNVLRKAVGREEIVGGSLLVLKDGQEIFYHGEGFADREANRPMSRDTIFRLFSMSKPVTAAAVMLLMERGELDLCEPVGQFLPGFRGQTVQQGEGTVPVQREMNIKDLLSMTSGLVYDGTDRAGRETEALFGELISGLSGGSPMSTQEFANRLGQCTLAFQPGSNWLYGTSADVLGAVVEAVSGKRFGQFLQDEIFTPLSMRDTAFWVPPEKQSRLAGVYEQTEQGGLVPYTGDNLGIRNQMDVQPAFESGGAGLVSTVDDYARFACMLLNGGSLGGVTVLRPATVKFMTSARLGAQQQNAFVSWLDFDGFSYGNLMRVMHEPARAGDLTRPGEYGWDGWLGCHFANCPDDGLTLLFMMQKAGSGTTPLTRKLRNIVFSACC